MIKNSDSRGLLGLDISTASLRASSSAFRMLTGVQALLGHTAASPAGSQVSALVRKNPQLLEESFCVRFHSPPPVSAAKSLSLHSDQPRPAPSLAGFFTFACGLGTHLPGPFSGVFSPFSSLFLSSSRTCKAQSPQGEVPKNQ